MAIIFPWLPSLPETADVAEICASLKGSASIGISSAPIGVDYSMPATPTGAGVSRILRVPRQGIQRRTARGTWHGTEPMHPCGAAPQLPSSRQEICGTKQHELTWKGVSAHRPSSTGDHRRGLAIDPQSPSWWRPSDNAQTWACTRSWPELGRAVRPGPIRLGHARHLRRRPGPGGPVYPPAHGPAAPPAHCGGRVPAERLGLRYASYVA